MVIFKKNKQTNKYKKIFIKVWLHGLIVVIV